MNSTPPLRRLQRISFFVFLALLYVTKTVAADTIDLPLPAGEVRIPVASQQEMRFRATIKQERDYSCGSAAVATLLTHHYDFVVGERDVFQSMYKQGDQAQIRRDGFSLLDMKRYLEAKGFRADGFRLPLEKLAELGVPAIGLINDEGYRHFVVIKGVERRYVLLGDPAKGTRIMARDRFETIWNGIAFVIRNNRQIGARHFNTGAEWQIAAPAPLDSVLARDGLASFTLSLPAAHEF